MSNHQEQYKKKPAGFGNTRDGRVLRTVNHEKQRKILRSVNFAKQRDNLDASENEEPKGKQPGPSARLQRWRNERAIKKAIESKTKKPAFKVGVVHHKYYSPPVLLAKTVIKRSPCHARGNYKVKHNPTPEKRITRATQRRLDAKLAGTYVSPTAPSTSKPKPSRTKNVKRRKPSPAKDDAVSFAPENHLFKPPAGIQEIPLFGRYVIPTAVKAATVLTDEQSDAKAAEEKPWPRTHLPSMDTIVTQKTLSSLEAPSRSNSSIESISLRLSSGDEAPEERAHDAPSTEISIAQTADTGMESDVPKITERRNELESAQLQEIEIIELDTRTPPRSDSPVPASFSPYIVSSRGKDSARRERMSKMGIDRPLSDDIPTKDTVMQNLNISVEEEERTAQYFNFILEREIERLTALCDEWLAVMEQPDITEDAQYQINQAVGQTKLLLRKKFERFRRLVMDCATGKGELLVQCRDLQGFWDLIYMEVKDCESRFLKLDFLRSRGWIEEQLSVGKKKTGKKKKPAQAKPTISAKSSVRSWILEARKKKISAKENRDEDVEILTRSSESETSKVRILRSPRPRNSRSISRKSPSLPDINNRTAITPNPTSKKMSAKKNSDEDGEIITRSIESETSKVRILRSPRPRNSRSISRKSTSLPDINNRMSITPNPTSKKTPSSLLKKVQLSQAAKSLRSPLVSMKISAKYKTSEETTEEPKSLANSHSTSGKRILKKSDDSSDQESCARKSTRKVSFSDNVFVDEDVDEREINEALENSLDLGRALAKIDSYDADEYDDEFCDYTAVRGVEKRLDFEDESFDETESVHTAESAPDVPQPPSLPIICIVPPTPAKYS